MIPRNSFFFVDACPSSSLISLIVNCFFISLLYLFHDLLAVLSLCGIALTDLYNLASSSDYIRDMRINEKLGTLLTLLMEQSWHPESVIVSRKRMELAAVKEYLDEHYTEKLTLDDLAEKFFINKFYLSKIFKETYGTTVNNYLISKRITRAKQLLRFTDMTVDEVGVAVGMGDANYWMFRKVVGISPREYRKQW